MGYDWSIYVTWLHTVKGIKIPLKLHCDKQVSHIVLQQQEVIIAKFNDINVCCWMKSPWTNIDL